VVKNTAQEQYAIPLGLSLRKNLFSFLNKATSNDAFQELNHKDITRFLGELHSTHRIKTLKKTFHKPGIPPYSRGTILVQKI
jgi:hypothetical protein